MNENYLQEGMDLKRLFLCFMQKTGVILGITLLGALLGGVLYQIVRVVNMPVEYQVQSKLYITFGQDETGEVYQYYNGYTWNDLMSSDPILDKTMTRVNGYTREQVAEATTAEILSDIRVLTITIAGDSAQMTQEIDTATNAALVQFADESAELVSIVPIKVTEPQRVMWDNHTVRAVLTGATIALILAILGFLFYYVLQDGIYVTADCIKRYKLPCLGTMVKQSGQEGEQKEQPYLKELQFNIEHQLSLKEGQHEKVAVISAYGQAVSLPLEKNVIDNLLMEQDPIQDRDTLDCLKQSKAVILEIPFGVSCGKKAEQMIGFLEGQDCQLTGIVITGADEKFLKHYYGIGWKKRKKI